MPLLTNTVAVVTGAARGIGLATAERLAREGATVVAADLDYDAQVKEAAALSAHGLAVTAAQCDVGERASVEACMRNVESTHGRIDVLVNNAGMSPLYESLTDVTAELYDKVHAVNARGPFRLSILLGERMAAADGGSIINVSTAGSLRPGTFDLPYAMAKAALNALTLALAEAWSPKVRANLVLPGAFDTDITIAWGEDAKRQAGEINPMGRIGQPDDMVGLCVFLASDASSYVNGAQVLVDGGLFRTL